VDTRLLEVLALSLCAGMMGSFLGLAMWIAVQ